MAHVTLSILLLLLCDGLIVYNEFNRLVYRAVQHKQHSKDRCIATVMQTSSPSMQRQHDTVPQGQE